MERISRIAVERFGDFPWDYEILYEYYEGERLSFYQYRDFTTDTMEYDFDRYFHGAKLALSARNAQLEHIGVFPNPAIDAISVPAGAEKVQSYRWYDLSGKMLERGDLQETIIPLPLDGGVSPLILILSDKSGRDLHVARVLRG